MKSHGEIIIKNVYTRAVCIIILPDHTTCDDRRAGGPAMTRSNRRKVDRSLSLSLIGKVSSECHFNPFIYIRAALSLSLSLSFLFFISLAAESQ